MRFEDAGGQKGRRMAVEICGEVANAQTRRGRGDRADRDRGRRRCHGRDPCFGAKSLLGARRWIGQQAERRQHRSALADADAECRAEFLETTPIDDPFAQEMQLRQCGAVTAFRTEHGFVGVRRVDELGVTLEAFRELKTQRQRMWRARQRILQGSPRRVAIAERVLQLGLDANRGKRIGVKRECTRDRCQRVRQAAPLPAMPAQG